MKTALLLACFFICTSFLCTAQLCNGNLGDPIINITFGANHGQLPYTATDFKYTGSCPTKGQYTLSNLIFMCGDNGSWLTVAGDHTSDVDGNYMLVNAESWDGVTTPAAVHKDTATGLCSNVTYVYSAWVTNVLRSISCGGKAMPASLIFKVTTLSGTTLATFNTGDIPIKEEKYWKQYGVTFQLPAGESSVIASVITTKKYGCGQGFAIDDITLRPCGLSITATINGSTDPLDVCADYNRPFILKGAYAAEFSNAAIQWQSSLDTGKTWSDIPFATSTGYIIPQKNLGVVLYRMAVAEGANIHSLHCRILSNIIYTNVHPLIPHHAPQNLLGCLGKDLLLPKRDPYAVRNIWTGPNGYSATLEKSVVLNIKYADTGLYQLRQNFLFGCVALDSFYVKVYPSTTISVPPIYSICEGHGVVLSASGAGTFNWQPATGLSDPQVANPVASPHDTILYNVVVTNSFGCKDSALVTVNVFRNPEVSAGANRTIVKGDTIILNGSVKGTAINFSWSPASFMDSSQVLNPKVFPPHDIQYTLTATSTVGCGKVGAIATIKVYNDIYVPTGFSPNNDGKNDEFKIIAADGYKLLTFQVYNRWGQLMYNAKNLSNGWNGTFNGLPQPAGTYVYLLQIQPSHGKIISKQGTVTLIR